MTENKTSIRALTPADESAVKKFFASLGNEGAEFFNKNNGNLNRCLDFFSGNRPFHEFYGAFSGCEMTGIVFIWDTDRRVVWLGIGVCEKCRGDGTAKMLMEHIFSETENRAGGILLRTAADNTRAQRFYEKCGFENIGTHPSGEILYIRRFGADD